jgi:hypothetical protein
MEYHIDHIFIQTLINALEFWPKWTYKTFSNAKFQTPSRDPYELMIWVYGVGPFYKHVFTLESLSWFKLTWIKPMKFNTFIKHISAILWHSLAIVTLLSSVPQRSSIPLMPTSCWSCKDIVFWFIIEHSSLRDFGP